jgi:hypothetical protein
MMLRRKTDDEMIERLKDTCVGLEDRLEGIVMGKRRHQGGS